MATSLMRSPDPDERLHGLERLADVHTDEALVLLERAAMAGGVAVGDPRALLVVVRALAGWTDREQARSALATIVKAQAPAFAPRPTNVQSRDPAADDARGAERIALARTEAAIALAQLQDAHVSEELLGIGRSGGPGQGPALEALALFPPVAPLLGGVVLTTPGAVRLAVQVGDLRSLDAIDGAARTSDPGLRAVAIEALGIEGDGRAVALARAALQDPEPAVRVAATSALVHMGTADAAAAVESLIGEPTTAREGLRLAATQQGEGVIRAVAAKAAAAEDPDVRGAAVEALGRQSGATAVEALVKLAEDPLLQSQAAYALARSPSHAALPALEKLAAAGGGGATRRLAARAYFAHVATGGAHSARLDALLEALAASNVAGERAIGVQAGVTFGRIPLASALADAEPGVRRAAILAVSREPRDRAAVLTAQLAKERDDAVRVLLVGALMEAGADASVSTGMLVDLAQSGGPCAPLAAFALARRSDDDLAPQIDALLASPDPILRAHAARGLALSQQPDAVGRLARAYEWEGDADVRRAIVEGLASVGDGTPGEVRAAPLRRSTLELAARLDPDRVTRWTADRARRRDEATEGGGGGTPPTHVDREVVWLRTVAAPLSTASVAITAALARPDGLARVIAFDDDGFAVITGVPAGQALLRLAPRLPAYESVAQ
jgi:HEAT repeat protein